ncbi:MAG: helix-turn-helix transcriptional regulator, partial [Boseongicola sp.]
NAAHRLTEAYTTLIERDYSEPVGVKHFAKILGVTPTHLSRACRQVSGLAALDILTDRRHFEACRLLKDSQLPVATIAKRTGFSSPAYFTRAFSARAGSSPSKFRSNG